VLLEALQDPDAQVVAAAVTALGPREDERVLEALDAARANPDPGVQEALDALESGE
jgi:HEAT repeat protein